MAKGRWYAVQEGNSYEDWGFGRSNYKEARKLATGLHSVYPDYEVRILTLENCPHDPICVKEEIVYEGWNGLEKWKGL